MSRHRKASQRKKLRKLRKLGFRKWMKHHKIETLTVLAASGYVGQRCQGCGIAFATVCDVLTDTVGWPWAKGRIAHRVCYDGRAK